MNILIITKNKNRIKKYASATKEFLYFYKYIEDEDDVRRLINLDRYDLALIDIEDFTDFYTVIEKLRKENKKIYILAVYKNTKLETRIRGYDVGVDDYFVLTNSLREFKFKLKSIERILNRYRYQFTENIVEISNLKVNIENREVSRNGKIIKLSNKEYKILEYFIKNPNRILTREKIIEKAWNIIYVSNNNIVDVYIANLRKKINENKETNIIETVRGAGYILRD